MFLLHFAFGIYFTSLKMTLKPQNNAINGFYGQNPMKKRYYVY